jgi:outer membrane protein assembly factor BamB
MNRTRKTAGLLFIAAILLVTMIPVPGAIASDADFVIVSGTLLEYRGNSANIVIPASVYYIDEGVFRNMDFIRSVTFANPDNIVSIGRRAFENCTGLTSITIPRRVSVIQSGTFNGCTNLTSVTLHDYLTIIGGEAFMDAPIRSLTLPYSIETIGFNAFKNNNLTSVFIPSVRQIVIADFAFAKTPDTRDNNPILRGASGSRVEEYARDFRHRFEAQPNNPPAAPPPLPPINIPPKEISDDPNTSLPRYEGTGPAPARFAIQAVNYMRHNLAIEDSFYEDYTAGLTRKDGAYFLVPVYFYLKGEPMDLATAAAPFDDTDDPYILKARELGLMSGGAGNTFDPSGILSRQDMTAMFMNLCTRAGINFDNSNIDHIRFADQNAIAPWALGHVRRAFHLGLISGTSTTSPPSFSPTVPITREMAFRLFWSLIMDRDRIEAGYTRNNAVGRPQLVYSDTRSQGYIEEAYYAAPVVVDLDRDGRMDIVYTAYSITCVDALTGNIKWQVPSGYDRRAPAGTRPLGFSFVDPIVMDVDGDGHLEVITGHHVRINETTGAALSEAQVTGVLAVYDRHGNFKPGWPKRTPRAINSVAATRVDGRTIIVVGMIGETGLERIIAYDHAGNILSGWPQLTNSTWAQTNTAHASNARTGYTYGFQNNTIAIGDIDGSGRPSIVAPSDHRHIPVFDLSGNLVSANPVFADRMNPGVLRPWGRVGTWLDYAFEKRVENEGFSFGNRRWSATGGAAGTGGMVSLPWEDIPLSERIFANFMHSPAVIADVDGDGRNEILIVGTMSDTAFPFPDPPMGEALFIFNGDRTRFQTDKYDWTTVPTDTGPIHNHNWREIILSQVTPVVADLNGNGMNDILFNSMSGRVMCYSLDKQFAWTHWVNDRDHTTIELASPLVAYDLNGDGLKEIIFATNTPYASNSHGRLIILDYKGDRLYSVNLPANSRRGLNDRIETNGVVSRPAVAEINGDVYIVLNTYTSGLTVYKIP